MLALIKSVNNAVNNFIWGVPAMILLMGVGLYLSVGTRFVQLRKFGPAMKATLGRIFKHDKAGTGRSPSAAPARCSGCGYPRCWACAPSLPRSHWPYISGNGTSTATT